MKTSDVPYALRPVREKRTDEHRGFGECGPRFVMALCTDGVVRRATFTGDADTMFSRPARVSYQGKKVNGYVHCGTLSTLQRHYFSASGVHKGAIPDPLAVFKDAVDLLQQETERARVLGQWPEHRRVAMKVAALVLELPDFVTDDEGFCLDAELRVSVLPRDSGWPHEGRDEESRAWHEQRLRYHGYDPRPVVESFRGVYFPRAARPQWTLLPPSKPCDP